MSELYNTFTHNGHLAKSWEAYGVSTTFDPETRSLELHLPDGWSDVMTPEEKAKRSDDWNITDPTFNVEYDLVLGIGPEAKVEMLHAIPKDDGDVEFRTSLNFVPIGGVVPGFGMAVEFRSHVKLNSGSKVTSTLIKGVMKAPKIPNPLPHANSGIFLVLEAGIQFFGYYGTPETITSIGLVGKIEKLETAT
jgi:hypothetical protein